MLTIRPLCLAAIIGYTSWIIPNDTCLREQVVTFLYAAAEKPAVSTEVSFSDVQPGAWYYNAVAWASETGVSSGMGDGTFGVGVTCTRAQVVTFLYAAQK